MAEIISIDKNTETVLLEEKEIIRTQKGTRNHVQACIKRK